MGGGFMVVVDGIFNLGAFRWLGGGFVGIERVADEGEFDVIENGKLIRLLTEALHSILDRWSMRFLTLTIAFAAGSVAVALGRSYHQLETLLCRRKRKNEGKRKKNEG